LLFQRRMHLLNLKNMSPQDIANFIINNLRPYLEKQKIEIDELKVSPDRLVELLQMIEKEGKNE
jgi:Asp-tRNA(Asn)/Glu-tRNA(Gln) amidotransferase B subunit